MLRKILLTTLLAAPLVTFAQSQTAYQHANSNASFLRNAPEIDGSNFLLGIALIGGILTVVKRRRK